MVKDITVRKVPINKLNPATYNPRKNLNKNDREYKELEQSINEFGYADPIIWNELTGNVVGGHQRLKILLEKGYKEITVSVVSLDIGKEKALNIALNKIKGDWDEDRLSILLEEVINEGLLELTGFDKDIAEELMSKTLSSIETKEDTFNIEEELQKPKITQKGDIWLLGRHKLICEDSTLSETYNILMEDKIANLVVTDPPYGVNYKGQAGSIKNDSLKDKEFYDFLLSSFKNMFTHLTDGGAIYVFYADKEAINFRSAFRDAGFFYHQNCIWVKNSIVLGRSDYQYSHEPIIYGWKSTSGHKFYSDRKQKTTWNFEKPNKSPDHPTTKPIDLIAYPIKNSSLVNSIVLDPFGGSGSTLIACEETKRVCHTIELDEKYADVIVKRYIEFVGNTESVFLIRKGTKIKYNEVIKGGAVYDLP